MIADLLKFIELTHRFQQIRRKALATGEDREENDSEHSFQLAMVAWYIIEKDGLPLNKDLVLKYALVHDFVEIYAGDTFAHEADPTVLASKHERERLAAERLRVELPDFPELHTLIASYEARSDEESKFVYALDKVLPPANIYLDGGKSWRVYGVDLNMIREHKKDKVAVSPPVAAYWQELLALIEAEQRNLFKE